MSAGHWSGPRAIPLRSIRASHSVEKGRRTPRRYLSAPIYLKRGLFGGYRVHDGNHRLALARQSGQGTIRAYVWTRS